MKKKTHTEEEKNECEIQYTHILSAPALPRQPKKLIHIAKLNAQKCTD